MFLTSVTSPDRLPSVSSDHLGPMPRRLHRAPTATARGNQLRDRRGTDWPGASKPAVYYDPRSLDPSGPTGVLHAKAVVVDGEAVFVTSANLTEAALDRNIELGACCL